MERHRGHAQSAGTGPRSGAPRAVGRDARRSGYLATICLVALATTCLVAFRRPVVRSHRERRFPHHQERPPGRRRTTPTRMTRSRAGHALRPSVATVAIRARLRAHHHRGLALLDDRVAGGRVATGSQGHRMGPAGYDARFVRLRPVRLHEQTIGTGTGVVAGVSVPPLILRFICHPESGSGSLMISNSSWLRT